MRSAPCAFALRIQPRQVLRFSSTSMPEKNCATAAVHRSLKGILWKYLRVWMTSSSLPSSPTSNRCTFTMISFLCTKERQYLSTWGFPFTGNLCSHISPFSSNLCIQDACLFACQLVRAVWNSFAGMGWYSPSISMVYSAWQPSLHGSWCTSVSLLFEAAVKMWIWGSIVSSRAFFSSMPYHSMYCSQLSYLESDLTHRPRKSEMSTVSQ
mmetsp:Transcript_34756/g.103257  ORF Transcript_34756/g.103257 Transcript_34756/m.103257 type:complete len:210 (+) Transcript_34756:1371-2000(+)